MYAKYLEFMVGSTNMYGGVFFQMYLLPQLNIPVLILNLVLWNSSDVLVGLWITSTFLLGYAKLCCDCLDEYFPE